ncbi:MAG: hypothetical protein AB7G75_23890 [Candidatus Binatia bacterium]
MSQTPMPTDLPTTKNSYVWVQHVPDGAVSVTVEDSTLVLKASQVLQERFEVLLQKQKAGQLSSEEAREYQAICDLDAALSWLNRRARASVMASATKQCTGVSNRLPKNMWCWLAQQIFSLVSDLEISFPDTGQVEREPRQFRIT